MLYADTIKKLNGLSPEQIKEMRELLGQVGMSSEQLIFIIITLGILFLLWVFVNYWFQIKKLGWMDEAKNYMNKYDTVIHEKEDIILEYEEKLRLEKENNELKLNQSLSNLNNVIKNLESASNTNIQHIKENYQKQLELDRLEFDEKNVNLEKENFILKEKIEELRELYEPTIINNLSEFLYRNFENIIINNIDFYLSTAIPSRTFNSKGKKLLFSDITSNKLKCVRDNLKKMLNENKGTLDTMSDSEFVTLLKNTMNNIQADFMYELNDQKINEKLKAQILRWDEPFTTRTKEILLGLVDITQMSKKIEKLFEYLIDIYIDQYIPYIEKNIKDMNGNFSDIEYKNHKI